MRSGGEKAEEKAAEEAMKSAMVTSAMKAMMENATTEKWTMEKAMMEGSAAIEDSEEEEQQQQQERTQRTENETCKRTEIERGEGAVDWRSRRQAAAEQRSAVGRACSAGGRGGV